MGLFGNKSSGKSAVAEPPSAQQAREQQQQAQFGTLKQKYQPVIQAARQHGIHLQNLHMENAKLLMRGTAPSQDAKNRIWDEIKRIDAQHADLTADITVGAPMAGAGMAPGLAPDASGAASRGGRTYTVKTGDTLSAIARQFYGDGAAYMKIFEANRDVLNDPDLIHPGQTLVIP